MGARTIFDKIDGLTLPPSFLVCGITIAVHVCRTRACKHDEYHGVKNGTRKTHLQWPTADGIVLHLEECYIR